MFPVFTYAAGVDPSQFDTSVSICTDFYRFANGKWLDNNPVPADQSRWGAFNEIDKRNREILQQVLEGAIKSTDNSGTTRRKLGDFYASGLAAEAADAKAGLKSAFQASSDARYARSMAGAFALLQAQGAPAGFTFTIRQDQRNSSRYIVQLYQGGLGLPEREYYLAKDEKSAKLRTAYVAHMARMSELLGVSKEAALKGAEAILALETALAEASMARVDARDPDKTYNLMRLNTLRVLAPNFNWGEFFEALDIATPGDINVGQPEFFKAFSKLLASTPTNTWRDYTTWHTLRSVAPYLGGELAQESFAFYGKELTGAEQPEPVEKRVAAVIDRTMGDALGQLYVEKAFSAGAKAKALDLVKNVRLALRDRIQQLDWMSPETKKEATTKLDAINVKIGYPDQWKDYTTLEIKADDYVGNIVRATRDEFRRQIDRLGKPVDRNLWGMTPPTVNAYYNSGLNEIVFPAGILQAPYFDERADDASNYGGIGMVIGHELTHGFDDRGRKFDALGNRRDWWTKADEMRYTAKADAIAKQYDAYEPLPGMHLNGRATLGENIADFGGMRIAYLALQKAQQTKPPAERARKIDGYLPEQRFFLNYAQAWHQNIREAELRRRILTDSHSPAYYRVTGPLGNLAEFGSAFACKAGDKMIRPESEQVTIW